MNLLKNEAYKIGIEIDSAQLEAFRIYSEMIVEWNQKFNITAITDDEGIAIKHFLDSLWVLKELPAQEPIRGIDIGTGGGFPGIPIKIMRPDIEMTLLDSLNKRIRFLNEVIERLSLHRIEAIHGRAEELGRQEHYREVYDFATSRAVAPLNTLLEYSLPFVKQRGYFISMKGPNAGEELEASKNAIPKLSAKLCEVQHYSLTKEDHQRAMLIFQKTGKMNPLYPRAGGKPKSKPL